MRHLLVFWTLAAFGCGHTLASGEPETTNKSRTIKRQRPALIELEPQVEELLESAVGREGADRKRQEEDLSNARRRRERGSQMNERTMAQDDDYNEPKKKHEAHRRLIREAEVLTLNGQGRSPEVGPHIQALVGHRLLVPCSNLTGPVQTDQLSRQAAAAVEPSNQVPQSSVGSQTTGKRLPLGASRRQPPSRSAAGSSAGISLIVWHKDDPQLSSPIFTIDARGSGGALKEARQQTGAEWLRGRAHLEDLSRDQLQLHRIAGQTPALVIDEARQSDAGLYTCTVEFNKAPTQTYQIRVNLIEPPRDMLIRATTETNPMQDSRPIEGSIAGPYEEDSRLSLICELEAGKPVSQVSLWQLSSTTSIPAVTTKSVPSNIKSHILPANQANQLTISDNSLANVDYLTTMSLVSGSSTYEENLFVGLHARPINHALDDDELMLPITSGHTGYKLKHWTRVKDVSLSIGDKIQASLQLSPLSRSYEGAEFLCLANNNHIALPLNKSVTIGMNLKPNEVRILDKSSHIFKLGEKIMIECHVFGSKPRAQIRWLKDKLQLGQQNDRHHSSSLGADISSGDDNGYLISDINTSTANNNFTQISYLTLVPQLTDNMKSLSCVASNPNIATDPLSDSIVMNVQYPPQLRLRFGSGIRPDMIAVGSDVFMECNIESNPPIDDLTWYFNDQPVYANVSAGVIISNQSLVLQRIRVEHRGKYQCAAQNIIGRTISNKLDLRPKFEPICDYSLTKRRYEVAIEQQVKVACNVLAEPNDDIHFVWKFNQSSRASRSMTRQPDDQPSDQQSNLLEDVKQYETNFTSSYATFSPKSRRQYGHLLCYASNAMGRQSVPCVILVAPPELPEPVFSCFFDSITNSSFGVYCQAPADSNPAGGRQSYLLEVEPVSPEAGRASALREEQSAQSETTTANDTNDLEEEQSESGGTGADESRSAGKRLDKSEVRQLRSDTPSFQVTDLSPATQYTATIYVQNSKGRSRPVSYPVSTTSSSPDDNHESNGLSSSGGRVQFLNKRLSSASSSGDKSSSSSEASLAARLISYLRVDDYLSRSVNNYYGNSGADNNGKQVSGMAQPLVIVVSLVLLASGSVLVVAFLLTRLCRSQTRQAQRMKNNPLTSKLDTYGGIGKPNRAQLDPPIQLTPAHSSSCSSSTVGQQRLKALAGGSGSETSRETNTDSTTLISSTKSNSNNNNSIIESQQPQTIVSSVSGKIATNVRSSRESLYGKGAKSPIMMMMRPSQSALLAGAGQQLPLRNNSLYSSINRQHCSPILMEHMADHSETPQMSIQSDSTSQTTTTATNNAELLMQVNPHADNHRELQMATSELGTYPCSADAQPLYVIRSSTSSAGSSSNFIPPASCNSRNQNCLNYPEQQSIRLVDHKGAPRATLIPETQQQNFGLAGWAYLGDQATKEAADNRSGNGANNETQVTNLATASVGYGCAMGIGNVNACNRHPLIGDGGKSSSSAMSEPPIPASFMPSSNSIPVSLSECQHLYLPDAGGQPQTTRPRRRRYSQEFQPSDQVGDTLEDHHVGCSNNGAGSYLTLAPAGLLAANFLHNNNRQQDCLQLGYAGKRLQQSQLINDLSPSLVTYVPGQPEHPSRCNPPGAGRAFDDHHCHQHQCAASQTLDNTYRHWWRFGEPAETSLGVRRGSFDEGPLRQRSRQGQRVKFDDQPKDLGDRSLSVLEDGDKSSHKQIH